MLNEATQTQPARVRLKVLVDTDEQTVEDLLNDGWTISREQFVAMPRTRDDVIPHIAYCVTLRKECPPKRRWYIEESALSKYINTSLIPDDPDGDDDGGNPAPAPTPDPTNPPSYPTPVPAQPIPTARAIVPVETEAVDEDAPAPVPSTADTLPDNALHLLKMGVFTEYSGHGVTYRLTDDNQIEQALDANTWITNPDATQRLATLTDPRPQPVGPTPPPPPPEQPAFESCEMCGENLCRCAEYQDNGITYNEPDLLPVDESYTPPTPPEPQPRNQLPHRQRRRNGSLIEYYDDELDMWQLDMDAMEVDSLNQSFLRRNPIHISGLDTLEVTHA